MKRSPIKRRSPMKRTGSRLRRTPLAQQSPKRLAQVPARRACCAAVRERCCGRCEARIRECCTGAMQDTHEILARGMGGSPTDPANCLGVCRPCHEWITQNPNRARTLGLLK